MKLLLEKLPTLPSSCRELVNLCVCYSSNKGCMMGECTTCSDLLLFKKVTETISDDLLQQDLTWSKWCQDENGKTVPNLARRVGPGCSYSVADTFARISRTRLHQHEAICIFCECVHKRHRRQCCAPSGFQ